MSSRNNRRSKTSPPAENCSCCAKVVLDDDQMAIQCDLCDRWAHAGCLNLPDGWSKFFSSGVYKDAKYIFPYICAGCKLSYDRMKGVEDRMTVLETRLLKLETVAPPVHIAPTSNAADLAALVKDAIEIESKKANAVLFGLADSENDLEAVRQLVANDDTAELEPDEIVRVFRDGPRINGKPRFLKICCSNSQAKKSFIKFVNTNRRNSVNNFDHLRARPDLSYLQRQRSRELQSEMKMRYDAGETNLRIDYINDCVVQFQTGKNFRKPNVSG
jgi:hypothetical protein